MKRFTRLMKVFVVCGVILAPVVVMAQTPDVAEQLARENSMPGFTKLAYGINDVIVHFCQLLAMFVISIGVVKALIVFVKDALFGGKAGEAIQESRLELGHSFSLGLGFLIGASILKTTVAPTWNDIGQLASIILIRTVLNFFLLRDIRGSTPNCRYPGDRQCDNEACAEKDNDKTEADD